MSQLSKDEIIGPINPVYGLRVQYAHYHYDVSDAGFPVTWTEVFDYNERAEPGDFDYVIHVIRAGFPNHQYASPNGQTAYDRGIASAWAYEKERVCSDRVNAMKIAADALAEAGSALWASLWLLSKPYNMPRPDSIESLLTTWDDAVAAYGGK